MKIPKFAMNILKKYAEENGNIVRSTSDISPLEEWLIVELHRKEEAKEIAHTFQNGHRSEEYCMEKAEEYLKDLRNNEPTMNAYFAPDSTLYKPLVKLIKQAKIDAIDAAVKMCAQEAKAVIGWDCNANIDKQSILQVADKLKKEFE